MEPRDQLNLKLQEAVTQRDLERVNDLLSRGADANCRLVNLRTTSDRNTLLHETNDVKIAKALLTHGASTSRTNDYGETPLVFAAKRRNCASFFRELLKHGANVNSTDRHGKSALNIVTQQREAEDCKERTRERMKVLLEYGAKVTSQSRYGWTPLNTANEGQKELLIKYALLKNLDDTTSCQDMKYWHDCNNEILKMKEFVLNDKLSLHTFVTDKVKQDSYCSNKLILRMTGVDFNEQFPIYSDIISDRLKEIIERRDLLDKVSSMPVYFQDDKNIKVILDCHSVQNVAEYLTNKDLSNFVAAFAMIEDSSTGPTDPVSELSEISENSNIKRIKLSSE